MEKEIFIIDRTEGNFVICEDFFSGKQKEVPITSISSNFKEGDVLVKEDNSYIIDVEKTIERKVKINTKFNSIW